MNGQGNYQKQQENKQIKRKPKTYTVVNYTDQKTDYGICCSNSATYIQFSF